MSRWGAALTCIGFVALLSAATPGPASAVAVPDACGAIPEGDELISGLATGQVLYDDGTVTLRFSDQTYACDAWPDSITSHGCATQWTYRVTLPLAELTPGTFDLHELGADYGYLMNTTAPRSGGGCSAAQCTNSVYGVGDDAVNDGATLEIYSVSDGCVTGKLSGLTPLADSMPMPPVNGAFFALPCAAPADQ
jgi:hypothetical protein